MVLQTSDLFLGTLDMLILRTVRAEPMHGWGIAQRIQLVSKDVLQLNQGSLYPALHRLRDKGFLEAKWGVSENNRRAKFYRLTDLGREYLGHETEKWRIFTQAVEQILQLA
ncbi:MAG: PadR family transcriptional regulator [Gemmatimonadota bacterium]|nr:PadR family transcriptional regulator [Gemmatimonadota bacterium]